MNEPDAFKIKRNIFIFVIGVSIFSISGGLLLSSGNELGGLVFILGPILFAVMLRFFGGDGWRNAGLKLNLKKNILWYIVSAAAYPLTFLIVIFSGIGMGMTSLEVPYENLTGLFLMGCLAQFAPKMIFSLFEEIGWRGYLEPQLERIIASSFIRHFLTGIVWALWHYPLILSTEYTNIPMQIFLPLFTAGIVISAFVYGQIRKFTQSVWPAVIMHGVANTVAFSIIDNQLFSFDNKILFYISPESATTIGLWILLSFLLFQYGKKRTNGSV